MATLVDWRVLYGIVLNNLQLMFFFTSFVRSMGMLRGDIGANISERKTRAHSVHLVVGESFIGISWWNMVKHVEARGKHHNFFRKKYHESFHWFPLTLPVPKTFLHLLHCRDCAGPAFCPELILCQPVRLFPPGGCLKVSSSLPSAGWSWLAGWWFQPTPLKNDGVRQLGWWHSQSMGKNVPNHQSDN